MSDPPTGQRHTRVPLFSIAALCVSVVTSELAAARDCTAPERKAADVQLWLGPRDKQSAVRVHLPWGVPKPTQSVTRELLLIQRDYIINYDGDLRVPIWTAARIRIGHLGQSERIDCFRADPRLNASAAAIPADYQERIFDQGHMTPNGDMTVSKVAVINSFIMSNMTPQYCQFNRGVWQILETLIRHWAKARGTVYVVTGSVFDRNGDRRRDDDSAAARMESSSGMARVAIPTHFFKIVLSREPNGSLHAITILLPHKQVDLDGKAALHYLAEHISSIAEVETLTAVKFFPNLRAEVREARMPQLWDTAGASFHSLVDARCRSTAGANR